MGRKTNYIGDIYSDLERCYKEIERLKKELQSARLEISLLKDENNRLRLEAEKNKIINDKDCNCSSIPSSKCNFKTGISNSRKKSTREPGAVNGHKGAFLSTKKIEELKSNPKTRIVTKEINCNVNKQNKKPIIRYMLGYEITPVVYEYKIYPNENGKYDIPKELHCQIQYSKELKTLAMDLYYSRNVSIDNITSFFCDLFGIKFCKGTVVNWEKELEAKLMPETRNIIKELMKEPYNHVDESQINVNGETYNIHNVSSNKYTMQWSHQNKSHAAIEEIGFLTEYKGTLIKDGTHLYDKYATEFVSCGAHINRYLIGANKGVHHIGEERMLMFLSTLKKRRKRLMKYGQTAVSDVEYKNITIQYRSILNDWHQEITRDKKINPLYDEERKLQTRLLQDEVQHLKFITNFSLPYTNNRAETDIRGVKQRQKVGIFRNEKAAERYVTIKSCISTYKKNNINVFQALQSAFSNNTIII